MPDPGYTVDIDEGLGTVTVHGSGFGTKPGGATPYFWLDVGHTVGPVAKDPLSREAAWAGLNPAQTTTELAAVNPAPGSSRVIRANFAAVGNSVFSRVHLPAGTPHWYIWVKKYYDFLCPHPLSTDVIDGWNWKTIRVWENTNLSGNNIIKVMGWQSNTAPNAVAVVNVSDVPQLPGLGWYANNMAYNYDCGPPAAPSNLNKYFQTWFVAENELRHSSAPGVADGYWQIICDAANGFPQNVATQFISHTATPGEGMLRTVVLDQRSNGTYEETAWTSYDSYFVEDSGCRLLVSDETAWQEVTGGEGATNYLREIQIPLAWSDTEVTFRLRQGSHATLDQRRLYLRSDDLTTRRIGRFTVS